MYNSNPLPNHGGVNINMKETYNDWCLTKVITPIVHDELERVVASLLSIIFSIGLHRFPPSFTDICASRFEVSDLARVASFAAVEKVKFSSDLRLCHI